MPTNNPQIAPRAARGRSSALGRRTAADPRPPQATRRAPPAGVRAVIPLALVLLAGIALRAAYLRELLAAPDFSAPVADAAFHDYWARALVTGDWTPPPGELDPAIRSTAYLRPPGYPYFLALVYALGGQSYLAPRIAQMTLGLLASVLAYFLARSLFGRGAGLAAAAFAAVYWGFIYYEGELQETSLVVVLALAAILALRSWQLRPGVWRAGLAGILLGLTALVRPNALLFVPVALLWAGWVARRHPASAPAGSRIWRSLVALAAGAVIVIAPVTARNFAISGQFVPISANEAVNLYIGNNPLADGYTPLIPDLQRLAGRPGWSWFAYGQVVRGVGAELGRPATPADAAAYFRGKAFAYIRENPGHCLRLVARRAVLFWGPAVISNNKEVACDRQHSAVLRYLPGFPAALAGALAGVLMLAAGHRRNSASPAASAERGEPGASSALILIALFVATYFASFLPFLVAERFRTPIVPCLLVPGGYALARLASWARARQWRPAAAWAVAGLACYGLARIPVVPYQPDRAAWHLGRAFAHERRGEIDQVVAEATAALRIQPDYTAARLYLAAVLDRAGRSEAALEQYRAAAEHDPADPGILRAWAGLLDRLGRLDEAIAQYSAALARAPHDAALHLELAQALLRRGRLDEADAVYARAQQLARPPLAAWLGRGALSAQRGELTQAAAQFRAALAIDPASAEAHCNLGNVLAAGGDGAAAIAEFRAALALRPEFVEARTNLGIALAGQGDLSAATAEFERAVRTDQDSYPAQLNLGLLLASQGRPAEARAALEHALRLRPGDPAATAALRRLDGNRP